MWDELSGSVVPVTGVPEAAGEWCQACAGGCATACGDGHLSAAPPCPQYPCQPVHDHTISISFLSVDLHFLLLLKNDTMNFETIIQPHLECSALMWKAQVLCKYVSLIV